jgi:hypothetical protein
MRTLTPKRRRRCARLRAATSARGYWRKRLENEVEESEQELSTAFEVAEIFAQLGKKDQAFAWLERAYEERSFVMLSRTSTPFAQTRDSQACCSASGTRHNHSDTTAFESTGPQHFLFRAPTKLRSTSPLTEAFGGERHALLGPFSARFRRHFRNITEFFKDF